jgi:hypothetical protein
MGAPPDAVAPSGQSPAGASMDARAAAPFD